MLILTLLISLFFPKTIFAIDSVKISNFSSNSDPEWVELINNTDTSITIEGWALRDLNDNSNTKDSLVLTGCISPHSYQTFYHTGGWLNNTSDTIYLYNLSRELIDTLPYTTGVTNNSPKKTIFVLSPLPQPIPQHRLHFYQP